MTLRISPHAIEQNQGPFIFPGVIVGSGLAVPDGPVHVYSGSAGAVTAAARADDLIVESSGDTGISILSADGGVGSIYFGIGTENTQGFIDFNTNTDTMRFGTGLVPHLFTWGDALFSFMQNTRIFCSGTLGIIGTGEVIINPLNADIDFRVATDTDTHAFFVQGSDDKAGFGTATIPHGGVGWARVAIEGANAGAAGPHMQFTTTYDDYPLLQFLNYSHDNISILFDAYYDGGMKSSDAGSSYMISKQTNWLQFYYDVAAPGGAITWEERLSIGASEVVFNQGQLDVDFRVESDTATHMLFVDGGANNILIDASGTLTTADGTLHVHTSTAGIVTAIADADDLVIESAGNTGLTFFAGPTNDVNIVIGKVGTAEVARLQFDFIGNAWRFTGPTSQEFLELSNSGAIFNDPGNDVDFRVEGVGETHAFFVQGSDGKVGFGTATIPHGGVGWARVAIEGANASAAGPHMQFTTASDNYPLMQLWNYTHDNIGIFFDAYFDGGSKSSDAGSSYFIYKNSDKLTFQAGIAAQGVAVTWYPRLDIGLTEVVVNEGGVDLDFRVESDNETHMLFVDGGTDRVGVAITPTQPFHVFDATGGWGNDGADAAVAQFEIGASGNTACTTSWLTGTGSTFDIMMFAAGATPAFAILLDNRNAGPILLLTSDIERFRVSGSEVVVNEPGNAIDFRVEAAGNAWQIFSDSSAGAVGIRTAAPAGTIASLDVADSARGILIRAGASGGSDTGMQLGFGWNNTATYLHRISSEHNAGTVTQNALHFFVWNRWFDAVGTPGTRKLLTLDGDEAIFNPNSLDIDFRVESDVHAHSLFVQGSDGYVGMGVAVPLAQLHIDQAVSDAVIPVLILDQADISEGFINFIGSDRGVIAGATSSVESVRVELGGVVRRIALYADA